MNKLSIGDKIKLVRGDEKQSSILPYNQGQLSQIESGKIKSPKSETLKEIVKGLNEMGNPITFEELIEGTTWEERKVEDSITEFSLSPSLLDVTINGDFDLIINHKAYPLFSEGGEKNEYCPETGEKLIYECSECGRKVDNAEQKFCMGCGEPYFEKATIPRVVQEVLDDPRSFVDIGSLYGEVGILSDYLRDYKKSVEDLMKEEKRTKLKPRESYSIQIIEFVKNHFKNLFISDENHKEPISDEEIKTELLKQAAMRITERMDTNEFSLEKLLNLINDLDKEGAIATIAEELESKNMNESDSDNGISE